MQSWNWGLGFPATGVSANAIGPSTTIITFTKAIEAPDPLCGRNLAKSLLPSGR